MRNHYFIKKRFLPVVFTVFLFSFLVSCQTSKFHIAEGPILQTAEVNGIYVECLYLDEEAIKKRHGTSDNPFLPVFMVFTPKPAIVFELKIVNMDSAPLKIDSRDIQFYFNDKNYRPFTKVQMEMQIDDTVEKGSDRLKQKKIAKTYMLGDTRTIEGNSEVKGYLVYMAGFPDRGKAELILPFKSLDNIDTGEIKFDYNFKLNK